MHQDEASKQEIKPQHKKTIYSNLLMNMAVKRLPEVRGWDRQSESKGTALSRIYKIKKEIMWCKISAKGEFLTYYKSF